jgi:hypothetical protein
LRHAQKNSPPTGVAPAPRGGDYSRLIEKIPVLELGRHPQELVFCPQHIALRFCEFDSVVELNIELALWLNYIACIQRNDEIKGGLLGLHLGNAPSYSKISCEC